MAETQSIQRLLALRQFTTLATVDLSELAVVADTVEEVAHAAGTEVATRGERVSALHLVVDGRITSQGVVWGPRQVFGLLEVLAKRPATMTAIAAVETRTFRVTSREAHELIEDNFGLMHALLRELATRVVAIRPTRAAQPAPLAIGPDAELSLVERLIVLRQHSPFVGGRLQALAAVAQTSELRTWLPGELVTTAGAPADAIAMIVDGTVRAAGRCIGPGDEIGALETLGNLRHSTTFEAITPVTALWCPGPAIVDVLEDHSDLGLTMIAALASSLLDAAARTSN